MAGILKLLRIKRANPLNAVINRDVIGIDLSSNNLKIAHIISSPNKSEVANLLTRSITGLPDADIAKVITTSLETLKTKNPYIASVVTSNLAITKNIEIPSTDHKEIKEIIDLQAGRHTPYSREEIIIDYIDAGTYKNTYTKILLVIVARNIIKRQFDVAGKAGLKLEKVFFALEALGPAFGRMFGIDTMRSPISIVNIDEDFADFAVVYKNRLTFVRSIPIGVQQLASDPEKNGMRFADELTRSLETYQGENIEKNPEMLVLTGALQDLPALETLLSGTLHLRVKAIPYLSGLSVRQDALSAANGARQTSFLNIIAPLLALNEIKITLVPEEIRLRRSLEERGKELIKTGVFVFTAFMLLCMTLISSIFFKTAYLKNLTAKYETLDKEARALEDKFTMVSLVRNYLSSRGYSLEVLTELHAITPINLELNDIRFDDQGKFSIRGTAESMSAVFSFVEAMGKSKYFKDVKTRYTSKRKEGAKDMADFEITASLNKTGI